MEEETLGGGRKGGGKEEIREGEWISLNTLSLKKTKIWQNYSISGEERGVFVCFRMEERGDLSSNGWGNMNEIDRKSVV